MRERALTDTLRTAFRSYPVVTLTGPRQSGKTTLSRQTFPDLPYVNLEDGEAREHARVDPRSFLAGVPKGAVLDEVQRAPELLSFIQVAVDAERRNGQYVLTGSHQLLLDERVSQSLAGRTALLTLLPLSLGELAEFGPLTGTDELLYAGFYPRIHDQRIEPTRALGDYVDTYVERDVRQLTQIRDLTTFRRFVRLSAGRIGQILNVHSLANDVGISHSTARQWLSLLEASYVVFTVEPYHANLGKRLIKSPKLYFHDVGLASYLLGIESSAQIATHPLRGPLFENLVVSEALKARTHRGRRSNLTFYRDSSGLEVDLLVQYGDGLVGVEIKAGSTYHAGFADGLRKLDGILDAPLRGRIVVHDGAEPREQSGIRIASPHQIADALVAFGPR